MPAYLPFPSGTNISIILRKDLAETGLKVTVTVLLSNGFNSPSHGSKLNSVNACNVISENY